MSLKNKTCAGIHYSQFVASWIKGGGFDRYGFYGEFQKWLESMNCNNSVILTDKDINNIIEFAKRDDRNLTSNAREWINNNKLYNAEDDFKNLEAIELKPTKESIVTGITGVILIIGYCIGKIYGKILSIKSKIFK